MKTALIAVSESASYWIDDLAADARHIKLCVAAGGEYAALAGKLASKLIEIGAHTKPRPFCHIQESWAAKAVQDDAEMLTLAIGDCDVVVLVLDLTDRFSRGAGYAMAKLLKERGLAVVVVAGMPFRFNGTGDKRNAQVRLKEFELSVDHVIPMNVDDLLDRFSSQAVLRDVLAVAGEAVANAVTDTLNVLGHVDADGLRQGLAVLKSEKFLRDACDKYH